MFTNVVGPRVKFQMKSEPKLAATIVGLLTKRQFAP